MLQNGLVPPTTQEPMNMWLPLIPICPSKLNLEKLSEVVPGKM